MKDYNKIQKLLKKDYMPIIYKNIKKFSLESGMYLIDVDEILDLRRVESNNDSVKTCSLKLLIKFSILYHKNLGDFLEE